MTANKVVLITGANGFIGSRLAELEKSSGSKVVKMDRELLYLPKELKAFIEQLKPNSIYHLAAYGNHYHQKNVEEIVASNYMATFNLLNASKESGFDCFINIGSSSEYGTKTLPMSESDLPEPLTFYGATKVGSNYLARAFAIEMNLPIVNVRPFSVYGPNEANERFIPRIINSAVQRKPLTLSVGVHDWIFIDDFVDALRCVEKNISILSGQTVNVGTGEQFSNLEVVKMIEKVMGTQIEITSVPGLRKFDTAISWVADISKLKSLGWKNNHSLMEGLVKTVNARTAN